MRKFSTGTLGVVSLMLISASASAQWEVEADPFAYMVNGFSGHVARQVMDGQARVQAGIFGADVPNAFHVGGRL